MTSTRNVAMQSQNTVILTDSRASESKEAWLSSGHQRASEIPQKADCCSFWRARKARREEIVDDHHQRKKKRGRWQRGCARERTASLRSRPFARGPGAGQPPWKKTITRSFLGIELFALSASHFWSSPDEIGPIHSSTCVLDGS